MPTNSQMGEAIALASPSGRISKRALRAAQERIRKALFGEGLERPAIAQPSERETLIRHADELQGLADRGMKPRAYAREAARLRKLATVGMPEGCR